MFSNLKSCLPFTCTECDYWETNMETRITVYLVTVYQFLQYQESYLNVLGQFQKAQVPLKPIKGFSPILLVQSVTIETPNMETCNGNSYYCIFSYSISIFTLSSIIPECTGSVSKGSSTPETNKRLFAYMLTDMSNKESFDSADLSLPYKRKKKRKEKRENQQY